MNGRLPPAGLPIRERIAAIIESGMQSGVDAQTIADTVVDTLGLAVEIAEFAARLGFAGRRRWATPWEHTPDNNEK